jgi:hypothetical protein
MNQVFRIQVGVGDEVLAEQAIEFVPVTPVFSHRVVSTLPDRDANRLSPAVAGLVQEAIEKVAARLMEQATLGALLAEPSFQATSMGYKLVEVSLVPRLPVKAASFIVPVQGND